MRRTLDPAVLASKLEALTRLIETARAIAPYRCELDDPALQAEISAIHELLLQAERQAARMRVDLMA